MMWPARRANLAPIPLAPRHRRTWRRWRRRCSCGLPWTRCPDRYATVPTEPTGYATGGPHYDRPRWNEATWAYPQLGRAGQLTPAQTWRANGGRW